MKTTYYNSTPLHSTPRLSLLCLEIEKTSVAQLQIPKKHTDLLQEVNKLVFADLAP
jgi:hypothetical protein